MNGWLCSKSLATVRANVSVSNQKKDWIEDKEYGDSEYGNDDFITVSAHMTDNV